MEKEDIQYSRRKRSNVMEEKYQILAEKILELVQKNGETDAAALSWETGQSHGEILCLLKEMEQQNWLSTYELDMCCGVEYIVDGLTEQGMQALSKTKEV